MQREIQYLLDLVCGGIKAQAVHTAVELGLPELVKDGPKTLDELALATHTQRSSLYRLLRVLTCLGVFEREAGCFASTSLSAYLQVDSPLSLASLARLSGGTWQWSVLGELLESVRTGQPAFHLKYGKDIWRYFAEDDPEAGLIFNQAMLNFGGPVDQPLIDAYDFSHIKVLVDVGGGLGGFLVTALQRHPTMQGILFDRPTVIEEAKEHIAREGLSHRCEVIGGDFFEEVPQGGDIYFLRQIIKDWSNQECIRILSNCRKAMNHGGRILVAEHVLEAEHEDLLGKLVDLQLLATLPGQEREESEFRRLFTTAQLDLIRILPTSSAYKILEVM